jgi:hypothetical protein
MTWWPPQSGCCGRRDPGRAEVRILFAFDPQRQALLVLAGDKADAWDKWYRKAVPLAGQMYEAYLRGEEI